MSLTLRNIIADVYRAERAPPERLWLVNLRYEITSKSAIGKIHVESVNITCFGPTREDAVRKAEAHIELRSQQVDERDERSRAAQRALSMKRLKEAVDA